MTSWRMPGRLAEPELADSPGGDCQNGSGILYRVECRGVGIKKIAFISAAPAPVKPRRGRRCCGGAAGGGRPRAGNRTEGTGAAAA